MCNNSKIVFEALDIYVYERSREREGESGESLVKKRVSNMNSFSRSPPRGKESSQLGEGVGSVASA